MKNLRPSPDLLVVGGSVPPGIPPNIYFDVIRDAKRFGVRTILDSGGQWLEEGLKAKPFLIKPNVYEAEMLLGKELKTEEEIIEAAFDLLATGVEIAVISRGKEGIIAATRGSVFKAVPPSVKIKSTLGAGDCTIAGLALKLAYGEPMIDACRLAVSMGTAAVLTPGTELCHNEDVKTLLPQVTVWSMPVKRRAKLSFAAASNH